MFVSARVSHSLSPLHVAWSAGEKRGDRQKLDGQREGGECLKAFSVTYADMHPHKNTVHLCAANALLLLPERLVQLDDLAWAHPAQGEVRLCWAGAWLPTERGGFWVRLPGVMSINQ